MTTGTYPRQPREGLAPNAARVVSHAGPTYFGVECSLSDGTSWFEVAQFNGGAAARAMRDRLNELFARPGADLDFIHPTRLPTGSYAVVWSGVSWVQDGSVTTDIGGCPAGDPYTTQENLYRWKAVSVLSIVTTADVARYGVPAWKLAFEWANNIRYAVNGWNCTQDVVTPPLFSGHIFALPEAVEWDFDPVVKTATYYGYGECQPNFTTANNEIFHTMDLLVAVPASTAGQARWARNQWVKVTYEGRSARARLTDVCGCEHLDLSRGLATYLRFPGGGEVTVSRP